MTNLQSFAGGFVWVAVAAVLMLITFEPISVEEVKGPALQTTAQAAGAASAAV